MRALNAYLSSVPSLLDGGPGLPIVADGFLSSGTCTGPANIRKKVSGAFGVATGNDTAATSSITRDRHASLPAPGPLTMLARRGLHAGAASSPRSGGRAGSNYLRAALADTQMLFPFFLPSPRESQPGPTATQDAPPHFTPHLGHASLRAADNRGVGGWQRC